MASTVATPASAPPRSERAAPSTGAVSPARRSGRSSIQLLDLVGHVVVAQVVADDRQVAEVVDHLGQLVAEISRACARRGRAESTASRVTTRPGSRRARCRRPRRAGVPSRRCDADRRAGRGRGRGACRGPNQVSGPRRRRTRPVQPRAGRRGEREHDRPSASRGRRPGRTVVSCAAPVGSGSVATSRYRRHATRPASTVRATRSHRHQPLLRPRPRRGGALVGPRLRDQRRRRSAGWSSRPSSPACCTRRRLAGSLVAPPRSPSLLTILVARRARSAGSSYGGVDEIRDPGRPARAGAPDAAAASWSESTGSVRPPGSSSWPSGSTRVRRRLPERLRGGDAPRGAARGSDPWRGVPRDRGAHAVLAHPRPASSRPGCARSRDAERRGAPDARCWRAGYERAWRYIVADARAGRDRRRVRLLVCAGTDLPGRGSCSRSGSPRSTSCRCSASWPGRCRSCC